MTYLFRKLFSFLAFIFGSLIKSIISVLLFFIVFFCVINLFSYERHVDIPKQAVLYIHFDKTNKATQINTLEDIMEEPLSLKMITQSLDAAQNDQRVKAIVARIGRVDFSFAEYQELLQYLKRFQENSDKPTYIFSESYGQLEYMLASGFDHIWMQSSGLLECKGFFMEVPFFKNIFEKFGINAQFIRKHEYKGAVESYIQDQFSQPVRSSLSAFLEDRFAQYKKTIIENRNIHSSQRDSLFLNGPLSAKEALSLQLVDQVGYWSDIKEITALNDLKSWIPIKDYWLDIKDQKPLQKPTSRVAIIEAKGQIYSSLQSSGAVIQQKGIDPHSFIKILNEALSDNVNGIILHIDSPGGSHLGSDTIWGALQKAKREHNIPIIVTMGGVAASGGYYIATAADAIVAQSGTVTGSIGVFAGKFSFQELFENIGINWDTIQVGSVDHFDSVSQPLSDQNLATLEKIISSAYDDFTDKVKISRQLTDDEIDLIARGRVWSGEAALEIGLVDRLGGLHEAKHMMAEMLHKEEHFIEITSYPKKQNQLDLFIGRLFQVFQSQQSLRSLNMYLQPAFLMFKHLIEGDIDSHIMQTHYEFVD